MVATNVPLRKWNLSKDHAYAKNVMNVILLMIMAMVYKNGNIYFFNNYFFYK